jgi:uncharacterized glyoxalase superfamily protein PhnB
MRIKKATPVLVVHEIGPCLEFWAQRVGFEVTVKVPEGERVGFAMLVRDGTELMYQSVASLAKDIPPALEATQVLPRAVLFVEVDDIGAIERLLAGVRQLIPRRKTFYGADEVIVADPAGNVLVFAQVGD